MPSDGSDDSPSDIDINWAKENISSSDSEDEDSKQSNISRLQASRTSKKSVMVLKSIKPVKELFQEAVEYHNYSLSDTSQRYDSINISRFAKRLTVQIKSNMFESTDHISIFSFLLQF